jgi:hypothetical protein
LINLLLVVEAVLLTTLLAGCASREVVVPVMATPAGIERRTGVDFSPGLFAPIFLS